MLPFLVKGYPFGVKDKKGYHFLVKGQKGYPFFGKNVQSMLKLGRAQGVAMSAALYRDIPIFEYAPKKIKMAITGRGTASKEQVAAMLKSILNIKEMPKHLDASDGLAAAVCHYFQRSKNNKEKNYSGWKDFLKVNPKKLK